MKKNIFIINDIKVDGRHFPNYITRRFEKEKLMLEGIICPVCENTLEEIDLRDSLVCVHCRADLKSRQFLDFLEFLMANGIVDNLDFFDPEVYSEDVDDLDQTKEEEGDPSEFEKKKDHYNIYENELLPEDKTDENIKEYSQFEGLNDEWEDFNERDFGKSKGQ